MLTFEQIRDVLIPAGNELMLNRIKEIGDSRVYDWIPRFYNVETTNSWEGQIAADYNTRLWQEWTELNPIPMTDFDDEDVKVTELQSYMDSFVVSDRYLRYGDPHSNVEHVIQRLERKMRLFVNRGMHTMARYAMEPIYDAFAGAIWTGIDGLPIASTVHDGVPYSNMTTLALTAAALQAAQDAAAEIVDDHGIPLGIQYDTLYVPPSLYNTARTLINNTVLPGGTNDELNVWNAQMQIVVLPWLIENATGAPAGCNDWWILKDTRTATLRGRVGEYPHLIDKPVITGVQMQVIARTEFEFDWFDWRGTYWSDGSAT